MKRTLLHSLWLATLAVPSIAHADVTTPFAGVTLVDHGDRAMAIADLCTAGVSMRVTKYGERKATPSEWAQKSTVNAAVAINGDFFDFPGWTYVVGRAKGGGENWPAGDQNKENRSYWQFGDFMPALIEPASTAPNAAASDILGGHNVIVRDGHSLAPTFDGDAVILGTYRRTGVGLDASRTKVYLFASNTALSGASMADSMLALAAEGGAPDLDVATNEDGGGSSQMYVRGRGQIIDSGRQVNDHLGIVASGAGASPMCHRRPATQALPTIATTCGKIEMGHGLAQGEAVGSCDGRYTLKEQTDGNLVLYGPKNTQLWTNNAAGYDGYALTMQTDGNLVDYSPYGVAAYNTGTAGHPGAFVAIQDDGNVVVYDGAKALFQTGTSMPGAAGTPTQVSSAAPTACGKIEAGHGLGRETTLLSCDRRFTLALRKDGNLVETETATNKVLFETKTHIAAGYALAMQVDGNLVLYTPFETYLWASFTGGHAGAYAALQDDGNFVVYDASGKALWNAGTVDKDAPPAPPDAGVSLLPDGGIAPGGGGDEVRGTSGDAVAGPDGGCAIASSTGPGGALAIVGLVLGALALTKRRR